MHFIKLIGYTTNKTLYVNADHIDVLGDISTEMGSRIFLQSDPEVPFTVNETPEQIMELLKCTE